MIENMVYMIVQL